MKILIRYIPPFLFLLLFSCSEYKKNVTLTDSATRQITTAGGQTEFYVPKAYNSSTGTYYVVKGYLNVEPNSFPVNQSFYSFYFLVSPSNLPGVLINNNQKGLVYFESSCAQLEKDALVRFPFESVSMFNTTQNYKPYRIKISNSSHMLTDLKDSTKWEALPIVRIDSTLKLVHFYTKELDGYVYCVAKR